MKTIKNFQEVLEESGARYDASVDKVVKKNYAEKFSRNAATWIANLLRKDFEGILPHEDGSGQESRARIGKGFKKLDVNYSTTELGLALGVSIKSIHSPDPKNKRYTKNYSRNDNELRAEATDYHQRQPYSILIGILFLPIDSCSDSKEGSESSFGAAVKFFRPRANRKSHRDETDLFERFFLGIYDPKEANVFFFDVMERPPKFGLPKKESRLDSTQLIHEIRKAYDSRNNPPFEWDG